MNTNRCQQMWGYESVRRLRGFKLEIITAKPEDQGQGELESSPARNPEKEAQALPWSDRVGRSN